VEAHAQLLPTPANSCQLLMVFPEACE
jgi:hypothetical protein